MEIKLLSCPLCLKPHFQGVDSLRSSLINVATSHLTCPVCNESLLGLDKLTIHLFSHINEATNSPKNEEAEMANTEKEINESINSLDAASAENDSDLIKCDICCFTFTDKNLLDMHQKLLHQTTPDKNTGLYSYHCHLCSKKFKKRGSLMVHLRVAHYGFGHQSNETPLKNSENSTQNAGTVVLPKPEAPKTLDNKQWECDVCAKMFTTKYFLKKHKRLHTGEMPYFCAQCNKSFTFQQSYHKHMLYHTTEKPYVCNECGRAFKELSTLQNHARIHSGERPFGCEACGKRFRQRVSYLVHQRIHTGVMPYKCTACEKSFRYKVSQRSHKCLMNPPGSVVRIVEPDKILNPETVTSNTSRNETVNPKCIMSVDYSTGSINFIQNDYSKPLPLDCDTIKNNGDTNKLAIKPTDQSQNIGRFPTEQTDLFSMVLSPLLPDVESLCLSAPIENMLNGENKRNDTVNMINDEPFKNLLYGSPNS